MSLPQHSQLMSTEAQAAPETRAAKWIIRRTPWARSLITVSVSPCSDVVLVLQIHTQSKNLTSDFHLTVYNTSFINAINIFI